MFIIDFFKGLFRMRVNRVRGAAKSKVYGAQARVKAKVSNKFNQALDAPVKKAKAKLKGSSAKDTSKSSKEKGGKMGWFSRKKKPPAEEEPGSIEEYNEEKTQLIEIPEEERFKPCVGWVVIWEGPLKGRDYRLVEGRNRIGRKADLEIVLSDPEVDPEHAHISFVDGKYFLSDEASSTGTYLNGRRVLSTERIVDNDMIKVGRTILRFKALY